MPIMLNIVHRRISTKALGVIQICIKGMPSIDRLPQQGKHPVSYHASGFNILEIFIRHRRHSLRFEHLPMRQ
jgi:hypothetical protein